jgi:hypothetical protein
MPAQKVSCREINSADIERLIDFRAGNSADRRASWKRAFERLSARRMPPDYPKYGYLLESNGTPVGMLLLIYARVPNERKLSIRCSVSNWYVDPLFRGYGALLASRALKYKDVTYTNLTSAPHTRPILEAHGYSQYCAGAFVAVPALARRPSACRVEIASPLLHADHSLAPHEIDLLLDHRADYGAISLTCSSDEGTHPFVFLPRRKWRLLSFVYLAFCRDIKDFVRFAGPLGRYLARLGFPLVVLDANGPIPGLMGKYFNNRPKYSKGPDQPRMGDIAYSELAVLNP